ncbi:MAG TPA: tyrosine-type recombinase/integrase [Gaiellaceae bacterium]|nr:tyrosine-type recombinase/integrase [Gaiellaceae bacterium]
MPLQGVDRHGAGWRARMRFGAGVRKYKAKMTLDQANSLILEWRALKAEGLVPDDGSVELLLRDAAAGLLDRKETTPKMGGRERSSETIRWWKRILKPWIEGPLASLPVPRVRRAQVEDWFYPRAAEFPKTGNDELTALKAALKFAQGRGARVDASIFQIEPLPYQVRPRRSLTVDQLEFLLQHVSEEARKPLDFCSTTGARIGEALSLDTDQVDFEAHTIFIPAPKNKEKRDKTVDLTREETSLLRHASESPHAPGVKAVFVTARGRRWIYETLRVNHWDTGVRGASNAWRAANGLGEEDETPFEWHLRDAQGEPLRNSKGALCWDHLLIHDLRSTAVTMMRDAGLTKDQASERIGHSDPELIDRIYDKGDRRARSGIARALDELAPQGLRVAASVRLAKNVPTDSQGGGQAKP